MNMNPVSSQSISTGNTPTRSNNMKYNERKGPRGGVFHPFPSKLHDLLESNDFEEIISWQPNGRSFSIHDVQGFVKSLMPLYFKQTKFRSFQRQLNLYNFQRITSGPDKGGYYHLLFLRDRPDLCRTMSRVAVKRPTRYSHDTNSTDADNFTESSLMFVSSARIDEIFRLSPNSLRHQPSISTTTIPPPQSEIYKKKKTSKTPSFLDNSVSSSRAVSVLNLADEINKSILNTETIERRMSSSLSPLSWKTMMSTMTEDVAEDSIEGDEDSFFYDGDLDFDDLFSSDELRIIQNITF